jgi:hypothetical protein
MVRVRKTYITEAKVLQKIVKSRLFDEEVWPANQKATDTMFEVFECLGFLTIVDDVADDNHGLIEPTPMGKALNIKLLTSMAGFLICPSCISDDIILDSNITDLDEHILMNGFSEPGFWHHLRYLAMRMYYEHYNIAPGSDEDPLMVPPGADAAQNGEVNLHTVH